MLRRCSSYAAVKRGSPGSTVTKHSRFRGRFQCGAQHVLAGVGDHFFLTVSTSNRSRGPGVVFSSTGYVAGKR
ncbi:hypothetical protein QFZ64_001146 [Streptomyces sp. B3I8]|nr:hypothetical protein [Streptomyces sp. B3I8]